MAIPRAASVRGPEKLFPGGGGGGGGDGGAVLPLLAPASAPTRRYQRRAGTCTTRQGYWSVHAETTHTKKLDRLAAWTGNVTPGAGP
jgi:hypothetical protein